MDRCEQTLKQDLQLLKYLVQYTKIDKVVADKALSKIIYHLWYFNSEQVPFAIFYDTLGKQYQNKNGWKI